MEGRIAKPQSSCRVPSPCIPSPCRPAPCFLLLLTLPSTSPHFAALHLTLSLPAHPSFHPPSSPCSPWLPSCSLLTLSTFTLPPSTLPHFTIPLFGLIYLTLPPFALHLLTLPHPALPCHSQLTLYTWLLSFLLFGLCSLPLYHPQFLPRLLLCCSLLRLPALL